MTGVTVVPYDPGWPGQFATIKADLEAALVDIPIVGIEHVGSTSVPGLAAKPVIDVDVIVVRNHLEEAIDALRAAGYHYRGDLGIADRPSMAEPGGIRRNVYVTVDGSLALRNHRAVREILRTDPDLRERYAARKYELAGHHEVVDDYAMAKSDIVQEILAAAGLSDDERAAIAVVNMPDESGR